LIDHLEIQIVSEREKLDSWLMNSYAHRPDKTFHGENDASYPGWYEIEKLVGKIFDNVLTTKLSDNAVRSLLFFIARSDEIGRIIGWSYPNTGTQLSGVGNLTYEDFVFLCERAITEPDDYCDYQLVACFQKLNELTHNDLALLRLFFNTKTYSYTRRVVVHAFAKFKLPEAITLIENLWATDECEFAKLSCLHSLGTFPESRPLFDRYLLQYQSQFPIHEADYRKSHMERFCEILSK
jgi:hypothetical protein